MLNVKYTLLKGMNSLYSFITTSRNHYYPTQHKHLYLENNYKIEHAHLEMQGWKYVQVGTQASTSKNVDCSTTAPSSSTYDSEAFLGSTSVSYAHH